MSPVSKRRKEDMKKYSELRKQFLAEKCVCEVWWRENQNDVGLGSYENFCIMVQHGAVQNPCPSEEAHHMARRGKNYLNTDTWLAVSSRNHKRIEGQSTYDGKPYGMSWARSQGFLL